MFNTSMFIQIVKTDIKHLYSYSEHLKALSPEDRNYRFGNQISDYAIDQIMLKIAYHPNDHHLWFANISNLKIGWGHLVHSVHSNDGIGELALSVNKQYRQFGIGDKLIKEMLEWAKFNNIGEIQMHCIRDNKIIQHLADKHNLRTKIQQCDEKTAAIQLPNASFFEKNTQYFKESQALLIEMANIYEKMSKLHPIGKI